MRLFGLAAMMVCVLAFASPAAACNSDTGCYGSLAVGFWNASDGSSRVAAGIALNASSPREADNGAMARCNSRGYNCQIRGNGFKNGGCGWVSLGSSTGGTSFGAGSTKAEALNHCYENSTSCDPPIGGCTASFNGTSDEDSDPD